MRASKLENLNRNNEEIIKSKSSAGGVTTGSNFN
jgi:hypothetical protein